MYGVSLELINRGGRVPLCLCVAGRGAAHSATLGRATVDKIVRSDTEAMLHFQGPQQTANIPAPSKWAHATRAYLPGACPLSLPFLPARCRLLCRCTRMRARRLRLSCLASAGALGQSLSMWVAPGRCPFR